MARKYLHYLTLDLPSQPFRNPTTVNILHQPFHSKVLTTYWMLNALEAHHCHTKVMLWRGLRQELNDISGHKHDMIKDFNQLRVALRLLEKDHQPKKSKPNMVKIISERQDFEELKGMVQQLTTQVNEFKLHQQQPQYYKGNNYRDRDNRDRRWNSSSQQGQNLY